MRTIYQPPQLVEFLAEKIRRVEPQVELPIGFERVFEWMIRYFLELDGELQVDDDRWSEEMLNLFECLAREPQTRELGSAKMIEFIGLIYSIAIQGGDKVVTFLDFVESAREVLGWPQKCLAVSPHGVWSRRGFERRAGVKVCIVTPR